VALVIRYYVSSAMSIAKHVRASSIEKGWLASSQKDLGLGWIFTRRHTLGRELILLNYLMLDRVLKILNKPLFITHDMLTQPQNP
jgi:hypothetical protein